jgi:predicted  nucleic acid-binding Zn-ribbon protein
MVEREIVIQDVEGQPKQMQMKIKVDKRVFLDDQDAAVKGKGMKKSFSYSITQNGESYGIVSGEGNHTSFTGTWNEKTGEAIKRAHSLAHGTFLWFTRKDKSYFVDDPGVIAQIDAMQRPMEALQRQQERLERQQAELDSQQEKLGTEQRLASMPTPDIAKEMAELNAAAAKLQAKKTDHMTVDEWADLQSKIGNLQGKLGFLEGEIGKAQGRVGELQGKLGGEQGKLGAEQGRLGAEQGHLAMEMDRKVRSIIDQCLKDGKARPVE